MNEIDERSVATTTDANLLYKKIKTESFIASNCFTRIIPMVKQEKILRLMASRGWLKNNEPIESDLPQFLRHKVKCVEDVGVTYDVRRSKERAEFPVNETIDYIRQSHCDDLTIHNIVVRGKMPDLGDVLNKKEGAKRFHPDTEYAVSMKNTPLSNMLFLDDESVKKAITEQHQQEMRHYHMQPGILDVAEVRIYREWMRGKGDKLPTQYIKIYSSGKLTLDEEGIEGFTEHLRDVFDQSKFVQAKAVGDQKEPPLVIEPIQERQDCWRPEYGWFTKGCER